MSAQDAYDSLLLRYKEIALYSSMASALGWDQRTYMPEKAIAYRAEQLSHLAGLTHRLATSDEVGGWISTCEDELGVVPDLSENEIRRVNVREWRRDYDRATKLSPRLVEDLTKTSSLAEEVWIEARRTSNFPVFAPWLEKVLALVREQAECWGYAQSPYDALLEEYEPGATVAELVPVFASLQAELMPLLPKLRAATGDLDLSQLDRDYPIAQQQIFNQEVAAALGYDFSAGRIDTTTHPFCTKLGPCDVRLTTRYHLRQFSNSLFGVMHEAGHGLYEQGLPAASFGTPAGTSVSLGIHESQSRLWELFVGGSPLFWRHWYPRLIELFPDLASVPVERLARLLNKIEPSFIRVEADEAHYNLHIVLRFELEQRLVAGDLAAVDLPALWNDRFEQLFGLPVPDDARGCLQDVHWAFGLIGYFPTYTLGTLNAAQLFAAAQRQMPQLNDELAAGRYAGLLAWTRDKIHCHGRRYSATELMRQATGEPTQAHHFIAHLRTKYNI